MTDLLTAFEHLGKVVRPTAWGNPVDLPAIRAELRARTGQPGTTDGPRTTWTYEYPDLDKVPDAIAACEAALKAADLHEQEVWALQTVLEEARDVSSEAKNHTASHGAQW